MVIDVVLGVFVQKGGLDSRHHLLPGCFTLLCWFVDSVPVLSTECVVGISN